MGNPELVFDSSAVILLAKAGLLREVCMAGGVNITGEVESEVLKGLESGRKDALLARELIKEGKIRMMQHDKALASKLQKDFNLDLGEATAIAAAVATQIPAVTDDNKARIVGKILGLAILSSLDFPLILHLKGVISYDKAKICLDILKKEGWYGEEVMAKAYRALEEAAGGG